MKKSVIFILILLLPLFSFSQSTIDSMLTLTHELLENAENDTMRARYYNQLSYYSRKKDIDKSLEYANTALELSKKTKHTISLYKAHENIGFGHMNKGEFDEAEKKFNIIYDYAKKSNNKGMIYKSLDNIGEIFYSKGDYPNALNKFEEALSAKEGVAPPRDLGDSYLRVGILAHYGGDNDKGEKLMLKARDIFKEHSKPSTVKAVEINLSEVYISQGKWKEAEALQLEIISFYEKSEDRLTLAMAYSNHGLLKKEMGNYEVSIKNFKKAKDIGEELGNLDEILFNLIQIGNLNLEMGDLEQAMTNAKKVLEISKEIGSIGQESDAYVLIGEVHYKLNELNDALDNKKSALALKREMGERETEAYLLNSIAKIYLSQKENDLAITSLNESMSISKEIENPRGIGSANLQYANYFTATNQLDSALAYGNKALISFNEIGITEDIKNSHKVLHSIHKKSGNYEESLIHHEQLFAISNEIFSDNAQKIISTERVKQNVEDAEEAKEKAELQAKVLSSRNTLFGTIAAALLGLLLIGIYFYNKLKKSRKEIESQNIQLQQLNATKDKFFGIIAHDIRSPIVALDGVGDLMDHYVEKNNKDKLKRLAGRVGSTAKQLGGLLDNLLNWALLQQGVIPYHPKALSVNNVAENILDMFHNNAESKGVNLVSNIDTNLMVNADESALNTILRNLVSNAIKFTPSGGTVSISTESKEGKVFININDTGTGISAEKLKTLFTLEKKSEKGTAGEKGTGLGLTLVKELAELNKGVLNVTSKLNEGSQFRIGLPMVA